MKGVVVYKTKYGATSQYAQWISKDLNLPFFEIDELDDGQLDNNGYIIIGSSVYVGKLLIEKWLKNNLKLLLNKKIFLFIVCGTPLNKKDKLDSYITASVPAELRNVCDIFFLPGKLKIKELSLFDHFIIKMGARLAKSKELKKIMLTDYNDIKKENINEILNAAKKIIHVKFETNNLPTLI